MPRVLNVALGTVLGALAICVPSGAGQSPSQDAVKLSPQYYTVRFENDRVRVLDYRLKPGEKEVMHSHPAYVVHFLSDATLRTTRPDGTKSETTVKNGDISWREPVSHTTENIGRTELHLVAVELKTPVR
jgi:quercetin dioxygenase-like cupin family protein